MKATRWQVVGLAALGVALAAGSVAGRPLLAWNTTASAPLGLYAVMPYGPPGRAGDWVFVRPQGELRRWLAARGYLPAGALLLKQVAAGPGAMVSWRGGRVFVDGTPRAVLRLEDRLGRALAPPQGRRRVGAGEVLLIAPDPASLDSRYFGPVPAAWIVGRAAPLWLWPVR